MSKVNTHEAQVILPYLTKDGFKAHGLFEKFVKDALEKFSAIDGYGHGSVIYYDVTSTNVDSRKRLVLSQSRVFEIRHHMKANATLKALVDDYLHMFGLDSITYVNFSNEFETLSVHVDIEEEIVEVKNGKSTNKK